MLENGDPVGIIRIQYIQGFAVLRLHDYFTSNFKAHVASEREPRTSNARSKNVVKKLCGLGLQ